MTIACLGWGSLIWKPESLQIQNKWFEDGPILPIEFTRQSNDGRITLIIDKIAPKVRVLWSIMTIYSLPLAIKSLKEREKIKTDDLIHACIATKNEIDEIKSSILVWLRFKQLDAALWTGLSYSD